MRASTIAQTSTSSAMVMIGPGEGTALASRGIRDGDILVADAAEEPKPGKVCVAMVDGDVILATLTKRDDVWVKDLGLKMGEPLAHRVEASGAGLGDLGTITALGAPEDQAHQMVWNFSATPQSASSSPRSHATAPL